MNEVATIQEKYQKIFPMLVNNLATLRYPAATVDKCRGDWKVDEADIKPLIDLALASILNKINFDERTESALHLQRLDQCYSMAMAMKDVRTAHAIEKTRINFIKGCFKADAVTVATDEIDNLREQIERSTEQIKSVLTLFGDTDPAPMPLEDYVRRLIIKITELIKKCHYQETRLPGHETPDANEPNGPNTK